MRAYGRTDTSANETVVDTTRAAGSSRKWRTTGTPAGDNTHNPFSPLLTNRTSRTADAIVPQAGETTNRPAKTPFVATRCGAS
jgi:hypothetical protein